MPKKKKGGGDDEPGVPGWMVTYGDMMTLLLTFFVLLLSFATISEEKMNQAMSSVLFALGVLPENMTVVKVMDGAPQQSQRMPRKAARIAREVMRKLQVMGKEEGARLEYDHEGGLTVSLPSEILFDPGRADVKPDARELIEELGLLLSDLPEKAIEVRGHTDNSPIGIDSDFRDNGELSYYRARNVVELLAERGGIPRAELEPVACGEWNPVATNATVEGRAANRRVEIKIRGQFEDEVIKDVKDQVVEMTGSELALPVPAQP